MHLLNVIFSSVLSHGLAERREEHCYRQTTLDAVFQAFMAFISLRVTRFYLASSEQLVRLKERKQVVRSNNQVVPKAQQWMLLVFAASLQGMSCDLE